MVALLRVGADGRLEYDHGEHPYNKHTMRDMFNADGTLTPNHRAIVLQQHDYFEGLVRKYRYAASHSWMRVDPDPPRPQ
jgi:hypothetical protein